MTVQTRDLRQAERRRVLMRAVVLSAAGTQSVRVRDLTREGAGIACESPPQEGSDVIFRRGPLFVAARVAWADKTGAGLRFYRPLPQSEVTAAAVPDALFPKRARADA